MTGISLINERMFMVFLSLKKYLKFTPYIFTVAQIVFMEQKEFIFLRKGPWSRYFMACVYRGSFIILSKAAAGRLTFKSEASVGARRVIDVFWDFFPFIILPG